VFRAIQAGQQPASEAGSREAIHPSHAQLWLTGLRSVQTNQNALLHWAQQLLGLRFARARAAARAHQAYCAVSI
jgi:hypothetical protein